MSFLAHERLAKFRSPPDEFSRDRKIVPPQYSAFMRVEHMINSESGTALVRLGLTRLG